MRRNNQPRSRVYAIASVRIASVPPCMETASMAALTWARK